MSFWKWSKTAAPNATADGTINMAEGMPPSAVNDGVRALMAAAAKYRDDIAGGINTGGTSTAYTVSSNQVFDTLAHLDGAMIAFVPHATNGATVTLNVDGLGAKPLRPAPSVELQSGALVQGTPYVATYNNSDAVWYLQGAVGYNSYSIPLGGMLPYTAGTAPNSAFVLPYGQAISRSTYATYFSLVSTIYGTGDGSTTFNVPDLRGRTICAPDGMGGSLANRITSVVSNALGATGGAQQTTLVTNNLPPYTPSVGLSGTGTMTVGIGTNGQTGALNAGGNRFPFSPFVAYGSGTLDNTTFAVNPGSLAITVNAQGGTSTPFNSVQPTIAINYILRII